MSKHKRPRHELEQELREQAEALRSSAAAYDDGRLWEAKRLATSAYLLLHDGGRNSKSLLGQLGLKGQMLSTADHSGSALLPLANVTVEFGIGGKDPTFVPVLGAFKTSQLLPFSRWYEEPVYKGSRLTLTRKNLIFTLRSQAGGAHVDEGITDEAFNWLRTGGPIRVSIGPWEPVLDADGNEIPVPPELQAMRSDFDGPVPNGHLASMRQIAWEIDVKLQTVGY